MKKLITSIVVVLLSVQFYANAQYSLSSIERLTVPIGFSFFNVPPTPMPAPGTVAEPGPDYSGMDVTSRPVWFMVASCGSYSSPFYDLQVRFGIIGETDSVSIRSWGPLTDTTNLVSQLNASNIFSSYNTTVNYMSWNMTVGQFPTNPKGNIFIFLVCSTDSVGVLHYDSGPVFQKIDSRCGICNGRVTTLDQEMCIVAYDTAAGKNMPVWVKGDSTRLESYNIYREGSVLNQFDSVGNVPALVPSFYVDQQVNPAQKSYKYAVSGRDSCGNTWLGNNNAVPYHSTIYLQTNAGLSGEVNLWWNAYFGFTPSTYYIWRGSSQNNISVIDSISSSSTAYTDFNAPTGSNYYRISIIKPGGCQVDSNSYIYSSRSNISSLNVVGISENTDAKLIRISPNPAHNEIFIDYNNVKEEATSIDLVDALGKIRQTYKAAPYKRHNLIFNVPPGMYFIKINSAAREIRKKLIVQ